jgi:hypothetical protein
MKLNFKGLKKINIGFIAALTFFVVIIFELYFVYSMIYQNLNPQPNINISSRIVQVDLKSYDSTVQYLNSLEIFQSPSVVLKNSNPFKYNRLELGTTK